MYELYGKPAKWTRGVRGSSTVKNVILYYYNLLQMVPLPKEAISKRRSPTRTPSLGLALIIIIDVFLRGDDGARRFGVILNNNVITVSSRYMAYS